MPVLTEPGPRWNGLTDVGRLAHVRHKLVENATSAEETEDLLLASDDGDSLAKVS